jgi:hypothetical protein
MPRTDETISYVGWGSRTRTVRCDTELGLGVRRRGGWLSNLAWVAAMGFVSGFRKRDIAYFLLTRELSESLCRRVLAWEERTGRLRDGSWGGGTWAHRHQHLTAMEATHRTAVEYRRGGRDDIKWVDARPWLEQFNEDVRFLTRYLARPEGSDGG